MTRTTFFALIFAAGCTTSNSGGDVVPIAGTWHYDEITPVSNTCGAAAQSTYGDFGIDQVTALQFEVLPNDGTPMFPCSLEGASFQCPNRAAGTMTYPSAAVTYHATATGTFADDGHATGSQVASVDCVGAGCATVATFPCGFSVTFTIHAE